MISVGLLTRVTGKKAKVRATFSKKKRSCKRGVFGISGFWVGFWASISGSEKKGLFRKIRLAEIPENLEILEILENRQTLENKGESDHFLDNLGILETPSSKRSLS